MGSSKLQPMTTIQPLRERPRTRWVFPPFGPNVGAPASNPPSVARPLEAPEENAPIPARLPVVALQRPAEEEVSHPHTQASDVIVEYVHPNAGPIKSVGQPYILDGERRSAGTAPPIHGEHTDQVLQELGFAASDIERLRASRVVG